MSDPELDLEHRHGARPKVAGPLTTQTIQEEAKAAPTERMCPPVEGHRLLLTVGRAAQDFRKKVLESPHCHRTGKSRHLCANR